MLLKGTFLAFVFVFTHIPVALATDTAVAEVSCKSEIAMMHGKSGAGREIWVFDPQICAATRVVTPHYKCSFVSYPPHGDTVASCGGDFRARWQINLASDERSYFDTVGEGADAKFPTEQQLKKQRDFYSSTDLAPPLQIFPVKFIGASAKTRIGTSEPFGLVQLFSYEIANGNSVNAVSGEKALGCYKLQLAVWPRPEDLDRMVRDMTTYIGDLQLERVEAPAMQAFLQSPDSRIPDVCRKSP